MKIIIRIIAILLRVFLYFSPITRKIAKLLSFDSLVYSVDNLQDNYISRKFSNGSNSKIIVNSDTYFSVIFVYLKK